MIRRGVVLLAAAALTGCAFHQSQPWTAYEDSHPRAETAVFVALDQTMANVADARISMVDSVETPSWKNGHPYWVRVKTGTHRFVVVSKTNYQFAGPVITWNQGRREVTIPEMKARHVYVARYRWVQQRPTMQIEDLGENPDFSLVFGLKGVNDNRYKAEF